MTWQDALPIAVAKTGHARFSELCRDENPDTSQRDAYRSLVVRLATSTAIPDASAAPVARHSLVETRDLLRQVNACPHREKRSDCGCGVNWCGRDLREVANHDCLECIRGGLDGRDRRRD